jgi:hypothetical protein
VDAYSLGPKQRPAGRLAAAERQAAVAKPAKLISFVIKYTQNTIKSKLNKFKFMQVAPSRRRCPSFCALAGAQSRSKTGTNHCCWPATLSVIRVARSAFRIPTVSGQPGWAASLAGLGATASRI